jgi:hypothetical protein
VTAAASRAELQPSYGREVDPSWSPPISRLVAAAMTLPASDGKEGRPVVDGHLRGRQDAVCPRCLEWIDEREYVRRTAYGPLQHEACPVTPGRPAG